MICHLRWPAGAVERREARRRRWKRVRPRRRNRSRADPSGDCRRFLSRREEPLEDIEHALVGMALKQSNGNQIKAAKLLDVSRDALRYKMKKFGLVHGEEEQQASPTHS